MEKTTETTSLEQFSIFEPFQNVVGHFISTRKGGGSVSRENFFSIGLNGAIHHDEVLSNRRIIAQALGISPNSFVFARQDHTNRVAVVGEADKGKGATLRSTELHGVDAMVTNIPGICLVVQAADCAPILFFDPVKRVAGAAHSGWRGTVGRISGNVVEMLVSEYGSSPQNLRVAIGPSAGPCCYEVGDDVITEICASFASVEGIITCSSQFGKPVFDLWEANRRILVEAGVRIENIETSGACTICNSHLYFSARAGDSGRFGAGILIR